MYLNWLQFIRYLTSIAIRAAYDCLPDPTVSHIRDLRTPGRIGGMVVVDDDNEVIGIVSEDELSFQAGGISFSVIELLSETA